jgi:anti-anti-sigma regulatory factor
VLRITAGADADATPRLTLDGRIAGAWVGELLKASEVAADAGHRFVLDMAGVSFVDPDGVRLVRRLLEEGAVIRNCSPFVREQLEGACDDGDPGR